MAQKQRFDLPNTGSRADKHKDLYSAWLISCWQVYDKIKVRAANNTIKIIGVLTPRNSY